MLAPRIQTAGVSVATEGLDIDLRLPGDGDQLTQVFQNLIENAVKYGGSAACCASRCRASRTNRCCAGPAWAVAIEDRGRRHRGAAPAAPDRAVLSRGHPPRSREQGGTGLGLSIVKHIVNRHRGRLRIESRVGRAARFTVILPEGLARG